MAAEQARRLLRAYEEAEDRIGGALAGRSGHIRATADGLWMQGVLAYAAGRFRDGFPGIELRLRSVGRAEGLRLLEAGDSGLHCGGIDAGERLPDHLRREELPPLTMGVVAHRDHPLLSGGATAEALADWPWVDCVADGLSFGGPEKASPSLDDLLDRLRSRTGRHVGSVVRAGAAGLAVLMSGPYLAWLPLELLARLPGRPLSPQPLEFGRRRCPTGLVLRRSSDSLAPVRGGRRVAGRAADVAVGHGLEPFHDIVFVRQAAAEHVGQDRGCAAGNRYCCVHGAVSFMPIIGNGGEALPRAIHPPSRSRPGLPLLAACLHGGGRRFGLRSGARRTAGRLRSAAGGSVPGRVVRLGGPGAHGARGERGPFLPREAAVRAAAD